MTDIEWGWLEWHALLSLILLTFVFLPYYQRRSVTTMPEFLELRYNVGARTLFAIAILLFEMVIGMPFLLYTGGLVIRRFVTSHDEKCRL